MCSHQSKIDSVMQKLSAEMLAKNKTVTTVESCTGGGISSALTAVSGSSGYIEQAFITYSNEAKTRLVGVSAESLAVHGAVSEAVVRQMAEGGRKSANSDFAIAVSGVAGPTGGSEDKPVGTVWIGLATPTETIAERCFFPGDRAAVREQTILRSLELLYKKLVTAKNQ